MNAATIEMITDAVIDCVRERLPEMIRDASAGYTREVSASLTGALDQFRSTLAMIDEQVSALGARNDTALSALGSQLDAVRVSIGAVVREALAALPPAPAGERGPPGADGRDAVFTEPIPGASGRTVARGTVVQHRNALWYARAATDAEPGAPMSGYTLIVDGALPGAIEPDEHGALWLRFDFASGISQRWPMGFRPMQYAGVWNPERAYYANDCVTCEGSMWVARREVREVRPGTDAGAHAWTLAVKRGKDGAGS